MFELRTPNSELRLPPFITKVATQIRSSLDIEEILNTTVAEIRLLLQCDRVIIYKFRPDFSG